MGVFGWCCYAHPSPCPVGVGAYGQISVGGFSLDTSLGGGGVKKQRKVASGDSSSVEAGKGKSQFVLGCWQGLWKDERVKWYKT